MQSQVVNKPRNEGRIAGVEDIRFWDLTSFMCGATGMLFCTSALCDRPCSVSLAAPWMARAPRALKW